MHSIFKKLSTSLLIVASLVTLAGGQAFAAVGTPGGGGSDAPTPTPPIAVPPGYQVELNTLPDSTTGPDKIKAIYSVVFAITGALSLLMVTIGGFRYVASQGDPQAAARAKGTITYALIGLLVSVAAVAIVTFVIGRV